GVLGSEDERWLHVSAVVLVPALGVEDVDMGDGTMRRADDDLIVGWGGFGEGRDTQVLRALLSVSCLLDIPSSKNEMAWKAYRDELGDVYGFHGGTCCPIP